VLDPAGRLEYVNAGHVPPIIRCRSGKIEPLGSGNFPVGMFAEAEYTAASEDLQPGDFLVIYTDGVTESYNLQSEMFGEERLCALLAKFSGETVEELSGAVESGVRMFTEGASQADDITVLVVQYRGQSS
jgi:sigma-B regulation protein RsbU (phosphoserine phosphatase)